MMEHQLRTNGKLISPDDLMQQADLQFGNGLFSEAEQIYRNILTKNPRHHKAALGIALAALQQNKMAEAIQFMQQAVEIAPSITVYRRNLGELLRRAGQLEAAITSLTTTTHMEPHLAENHFLLGLAYNDNQQFSLAIHHYHTALSYHPNDGITWNNLGASLENSGDKQTAKVAYATAIALNSKHAEAQNNLAAIYSEEGRLDEARSHFVEAISANPTFIDAHYNLSLIKTYTPDDPHLGFLESILQNINHYSTHNRIRYYFALGKALDNTQQYTRAFQAYAEGNRLHYLQQPWDQTKLQTLVTQMPEIFNKNFLTRSAITQHTRCPIFIVGMPRAGTTLIEQILASHESIYGAGELTILDEIIQESCRAANLSFHAWVTQLTDQQFIMLGEQYLDRTWKLAPDKQFIVDKMPGNCFYIGMIYRMLPHAKIIHAIRDPMDSCFSCFTHLFKDNMAFAYDQTALGTYYTLYAKAMQHWNATLPENSIFNLPYEQMIANHEALSKQLVEYIGLPWDPNCLNFYENNRLVKTASLTQVRKPIYKTSVQRWRHFANELAPLLQIVSPYRNLKGISA
jgi:Flp pilus assembly protein TadD